MRARSIEFSSAVRVILTMCIHPHHSCAQFMCRRLEINSFQRELRNHRIAGISDCHSSTNTSFDARDGGTEQSTTPLVVRKRAPPAMPFTVTLKRIASTDDCNDDCSVEGGEPKEKTTVWLHAALLNKHVLRTRLQINRNIAIHPAHKEHHALGVPAVQAFAKRLCSTAQLGD